MVSKLKQQVIERLKAPKNKNVISKALKLELRTRFHTETNLQWNDATIATSEFLDWVKSLLPKDKYNTFVSLFSFPLPSAIVVEDVYRELSRVFYSRNSINTYHFSDSSAAEDWKIYRSNILNQPQVWKTDAWQTMMTSVNSVVIVDMPKEQTSSMPEPYFYFESISNVIDFESINGSELRWLIVRKPDNKIFVVTDEFYGQYTIKDGSIIGVDYENEHNLGFCPARFFWTDFISDNKKEIKKNPITKQLASLDWYLFFMTSKKHLDLYAPYPIYSAYEAECSFANNETGEYCDGGFLRNSDNNYVLSRAGIIDRCPICAEKRVAGPGSFLEVPIPGQGEHDLREPVQITTVDKDSLDYNVKETERLKNEIIISCVGSNGLVSEKEAINTQQIAANFENKTSVLTSLKVNFENIQLFVENTICKLRYDSAFISAYVNWGSEFYVFTVEELYKKYGEAKKAGSSAYELDAISDQIIETEFKDNPNMLQRMKILKHVEPFRHHDLPRVIELYSKGLASQEAVIIKTNLSSFVDRFERENTNIVDFGSAISFDKKITTIQSVINQYAEDYVKTIKPVGISEAAKPAAEVVR